MERVWLNAEKHLPGGGESGWAVAPDFQRKCGLPFSEFGKALIVYPAVAVFNAFHTTAQETFPPRLVECFHFDFFLQVCWPACKERVEATKGFILQIQQGTTHQKSDMQKAEEMQTKWIKVPRIAVYAFEGAAEHLVGGNTLAKTYMETALAKAEEQWTKGVEAEVQMCSERFEPVDGADKVPTDERGHVHGRAKCTYPDGAVYIGQFQHGKMHGQGKYTFADGAFELGFSVANDYSGEFVRFSKDRQKAWLLKDGKSVRELSQSEAAKKVEELALSELLSWNVLDPIWKDFGRRKVTKSCQIVVKFAKKWAKSWIILTAKSTAIGFEHYNSLMFSLSCFYLQKKAATSQNEMKWLRGFFATFLC